MTTTGAPINVDSATLVKPTRWHLKPDRMVLSIGDKAMTLSEAMESDAPVIPPSRAKPASDAAAMRKALAEADPRILLMSLVHLTGDEGLLDRFAPYITAQVAGAAKGVAQAGMPEEMQQELRDRIAGILEADPGPAGQPISARLVQKMMNVCSGDVVGDDYVPFILEQAGFTGTQGVDNAARQKPPEGFKILIVGSGLSGIALGTKLGELGYDYEIVERNSDVGGTWWLNRYPGVGVDTPSHYYSYSFDINPDWPRYFSQGPDLIAYFQRAADKFGVRERIRFETEVLSATFDESAAKWQVRLREKDGSERVEVVDVFIPAIAFTCAPSIPDLKGLDGFKGRIMHTAEWDESVDLTGKRVAVLGTGASSMQACTTIAPLVEHLTIFQRSRHWIVPAPLVGKVVPEGVRWAMNHVPFYAQWQRFMTFWTSADGLYPLAVVDPEWTMPDVSVSAPNERRRQILRDYINTELEGRPDLIEKVMPDYPPMGKRIILDAGWYKMLRRDNVDIDVSGIAEVTADAIVTNDGQTVPVDVIVMATGFVFRPMLPTMDIIGRGGLTLDEAWADENPRAYLGMLVPDFPNLFIFNGPNSAPNHGAGQNLTSEAMTNYSLGLLDLMIGKGARTIEISSEALDEYNDAIQDMLRNMVWNHPKSSSYYLNKYRRNTVSCPWRLVDFWWMTRQPEETDLILDREVVEAAAAE